MAGTSTSGNRNARGIIGNKGGGRKGYEYEKDQLSRLRKLADRGIAFAEAVQKGKVTDKGLERFQKIMPIVLKALDKLQANKNEMKGELEVRSKVVKIDE